MQTLYDLLGALPSDDAEGLRTAFRKAVKGAHPDIHPDDPDAALKFRQIVRANDILIDDEQRGAYDHLLELAHLEQVSASRHAIADRIHKFASGMMAVAGVSVVTVGGYLLFLHMSAAALAPAIDVASRASAAVASVGSVASLDASGKSPWSAKAGTTNVFGETAAAGAALSESHAGSVGWPPDSSSSRAQGAFAYRNSNLSAAIAELDPAMDTDPAFSAAYIDGGIALYRPRKFDRTFADITSLGRIQPANHSKSAPPTAGKQHPGQVAIAPPIAPPPFRRAPVRDPSREEGFTSAMR